jgi:hypothetical protein
MKLTVTVEGLDRIRRIDPRPMLARLQAELDRELAASASGAPLPPRDPRAGGRASVDREAGSGALLRVLQRIR